MFLESIDFEAGLARTAVEPEGPRKPFWRHDFSVLAAEPVLPAVPGENVSPLAARAEVHFADHHGHVSRPPPAPDMLGLAVRLEDQAARGVENAGELDLEVRLEGQRHGADLPASGVANCCRHGLSPFLEARSGTRRVDRSARPRCGGSARPSRLPP